MKTLTSFALLVAMATVEQARRVTMREVGPRLQTKAEAAAVSFAMGCAFAVEVGLGFLILKIWS